MDRGGKQYYPPPVQSVHGLDFFLKRLYFDKFGGGMVITTTALCAMAYRRATTYRKPRYSRKPAYFKKYAYKPRYTKYRRAKPRYKKRY